MHLIFPVEHSDPLFLLSLSTFAVPPTPIPSFRQAGSWKQLSPKTRVL